MAHEFIGDLSAAVDIPSDGTLSRVLSKADGVRLVAFAFDTAQELTEHTAGVPAVVQVISGTIRVTIDGDEHTLTPASWLYMAAGTPHSVVADEPSRMLLTMLR